MIVELNVMTHTKAQLSDVIGADIWLIFKKSNHIII